MTPYATPPSFGRVSKIRRSQVVTVFGPGSIVDTFDDSATVKGLAHWPDPRQIDRIEDERLQGALNIDFLYQPPGLDDGNPQMRLPLLKFPSVHYCPSCHQLSDDFTPQERRKDGVRCTACKKQLMIPARFVAACSLGHAEDFPFRKWAHKGETACHGQLKMETLGKSAGLRDVRIDCDCGSRRVMEGAFSEGALLGVGATCGGRFLWRGPRASHCEADLRALQRGASNFYFAETMSSLCIPPWEGRITEIVRRFQALFAQRYPDPTNPLDRAVIQDVLRQPRFAGLGVEDVFAWAQRAGLARNQRKDQQAFKVEEYAAFSEAASSDTAWPRFEVRSSPVPDQLSSFLDKVVLADVLEEVRALVGFRRIDPWSPEEGEGPVGNLVQLREPGVRWLPGVRLTGEGIFLRFTPGPLSAWANLPSARSRSTELQDQIDARVAKGRGRPVGVTPQLLLLHSFAHAVMLRLSLDCGYSSGALRERIYSGENPGHPGRSMAGVLIYTGSTDSEGTLGGLVSMGEATVLGNVVTRAIREASWCSSDPICSEVKNTGERTMNLAACHACLFVPETSCELFNSVLDRQSLVGDLNGDGGYLGDL
jgi:hypothetical protein